MKIDVEQLDVINNVDQGRFEVTVDDYLAVMEYMMARNTIIFTHTYVPEPISGQGIGEHMAHVALEHAKDNGLTVKPLCPFVRAYIREHEEYHSITRGL